jgi:hypothetical protein
VRRHLGKRLKSGLCLLFLALLPVLLFYPASFQGEIPFEPFNEDGPGLLANRYLPWYGFLHASRVQGELPLWRPGANGGLPFFALWESRCLSPFSLPFYLLPPLHALSIAFFLRLIAASWCAYFACRRLGFSPLLAVFGGVSWGLSPMMILWHGYPAADVLPFFPLLVVFVERQMLGQGRFWALGALFLALSAFGGDLKMLAAMLLFLALVVLVRLVANRSAHVRNAWSYSGLAMAIIFALGLISVQGLPYLQFALERAPADAPTVSAPGWQSVSGVMFGHGLGPDTSPFAGSPSHGRYMAAVHAGLIPLLLALLWLAVRRNALPAQRRRIESWWGASLVLTLSGVPAAMLLQRLGVDFFRPVPYMTFANPFIWALVGIAAADTWLALGPTESAAALRRFFKYFAVAIAAAVILGAVGWRQQAYAVPAWEAFATTGALSALFALLIVYTLLRPRRHLTAAALIALAAFDLWLVAMPALVFESPERLEAVPPQIEALNVVDGPVAGAPLGAAPLLGLRQNDLFPALGGVSLRRTAAFLERAEQAPLLYRRAGFGGYILGAEDIEGRHGDLRGQLHLLSVLPGGRALFIDPHARPAAWITHEGRPVEAFDPRDLSPHDAPLLETGDVNARVPKASDPAWTPAQIVSHGSNRVAVEAVLDRPGVLVLAEAWYPGWQAAVNGLPVVVFPVDGMFRGVALEAGRHEVVFYFNPPEVKYGLAVTLMAALGTGLGLLYLMGANLKQLFSRR